MWEGKPTCVGGTDVCETTVTHKPLSTTIHDTSQGQPTTGAWSGMNEMLRTSDRYRMSTFRALGLRGSRNGAHTSSSTAQTPAKLLVGLRPAEAIEGWCIKYLEPAFTRHTSTSTPTKQS